MKLFNDIVRHSYEAAGYAESNFSYLNRSAREEFARMRSLLEEWFGRYPPSGQPELQSRFRSDIDHQHQAAFFELFLHELLLRLGCQVTLHPSIVGTAKVPDFLAESQTVHKFYLEATVATNESADEAAARARMNTVYDALDRLVKSPDFFLWLVVEGAPTTPPPARKLATFVNDQLANLNPDEVTQQYESHGISGLPHWHFEHEGWKIEIRPTPKKPEARGRRGVRPIGMRSTGLHRVDHRTPIRDSIIDKANKYGELDLPYVIAVNATEPIDEIDIMEALFGKEQYLVSIAQEGTNDSEPEMTRVPDGVWVGPRGPRYTRVSAVLMATRLSIWNIPRANLCLYHNPWAQRPYQSVLTRLPQAVPANGHMEWSSGASVNAVFELPLSWPENAF